ncbi:sensor histidine kinase [Shewanella mangrovisoli]|uniref:sensor histidine kinase n=1 Tax=Shewanella mangrovisoli TaxID=2864211 RepID=UPI0035B6CBE6
MILKRAITSQQLFWRYWLKLMLPWLLLVPLLSLVLYQKRHEDAMTPLYRQADAVLADANQTIAYYLGSLKRDALFLAKYQLLIDTASGKNAELAAVENFFKAFSDASLQYDQVRWLDNDAMEKVRINLINHEAQIVPQAELQSKQGRYYIAPSLALEPDTFYFSPLDLNVENKVIESPIKPMLRITTPVFLASGERQGFIALNFLAQTMLDAIANTAKEGVELSMLNSDGYWLLAPQPQMAWGFMYGREEVNFSKFNPSAWQEIRKNTEVAFTTQDGLWDYENVHDIGNAALPEWRLVTHISHSVLASITKQCIVEALSIGLLLLLLGSAVCWRTAKSMCERDKLHDDLTEQQRRLANSNKALAQSLQHLHDTQQQLIETGKLSSLGMMVAGVAHELNTPVGASLMTLSSMKNECSKLQSAFETGLKRSDVDTYFEHFYEGAEIVQANLERAAALVKSFKRLAVDRTGEERRVFKLTSLVQDMLHTSWLRMKKQFHELNIDISPEIELNSYPGALGQVLENLVSNALTHAFEDVGNGQINITAYCLEDAFVAITVTDNGGGMDDATLKQIFDPFFTTRRGKGGTGLGLHLAHQLVTQLLGGYIKVTSEQGKGTCFTLTIPTNAPESHKINLG